MDKQAPEAAEVVGLRADRLSAYLAHAATQQSELGGLDCVRFTVEALREGFGIDLRANLKYRDKREAIGRIRRHRGLDSAIRHELGEPIPAEELRPGDIAFVPPRAMGLVMPGYIAVKFRATVWRLEMHTASHGWRVT